MKPPVRTYLITRARFMENAGGGTCHFKVHGMGRLGRFLSPNAIGPEFTAEEGWFEVEGFNNGELRVLRQVDTPRR